MPRLTDDRYVAAPGASGFSVIFREPFVVGYSETMLCPIWVSQRWSRDEVVDHDDRTPSLERDWREDPELPVATRAGTSYRGTVTGLDRGHMARHAMNRAWGLDGSIVGCLMSNSVPQHLDINRGKAWGDLEDAARDVVDPGSDIDVVWVISGALFRDTENPPAESPDEDMERAAEITDGFRVPYATYKIVAWFGADGDFQARGYVFEQPYDVASGEAPKKSDFTIPDQNRSPVAFIRPIDEIETRAGVDFFPWLRDSIENAIESAHEGNLWGED
jgi:DNA/RNA endonuclease G (NUC1)